MRRAGGSLIALPAPHRQNRSNRISDCLQQLRRFGGMRAEIRRGAARLA
jgi:hypothetical protein